MAKKMNVMKLSQEIRGQGIVSNRQPGAVLPPLYMTSPRSPALRVPLPRHQLEISHEDDARAEIEYSVKIIHLV